MCEATMPGLAASPCWQSRKLQAHVGKVETLVANDMSEEWEFAAHATRAHCVDGSMHHSTRAVPWSAMYVGQLHAIICDRQPHIVAAPSCALDRLQSFLFAAQLHKHMHANSLDIL